MTIEWLWWLCVELINIKTYKLALRGANQSGRLVAIVIAFGVKLLLLLSFAISLGRIHGNNIIATTAYNNNDSNNNDDGTNCFPLSQPSVCATVCFRVAVAAAAAILCC